MLAITLRYLVQSVGALRGPMLQVSPRTVEAARSLGEGSLGVLRSVTLPLLRPGLVAGATLVLLSGLKELPLTLLLAPPGTARWRRSCGTRHARPSTPRPPSRRRCCWLVSFVSVGLLVRRGEVEA